MSTQSIGHMATSLNRYMTSKLRDIKHVLKQTLLSSLEYDF